jgi:hypothetical protein
VNLLAQLFSIFVIVGLIFALGCLLESISKPRMYRWSNRRRLERQIKRWSANG